MSDTYKLEKSLWTESDFESMGWHDATIHGISFPAESSEISLDIDYILQWVDSAEVQTHFRFWVSPATLVFWNVHGLRIDLELDPPGLTVADISRSDPARPRNADYIGRDVEWLWTIECHQGEISFRACGFNQHIRAKPLFGKHQSLSLEERGDSSFGRPDEWLRRDV